MRLHLDDDSAELIKLLRQAGHDVQTPEDVGVRGRSDAVHLRHALRENRAVVTRNHKEFEDLHDLIVDAGGTHPGIRVVRRDNDPARDLTVRGVVLAVQKLERAELSIVRELNVLNHWR